MKRHKKYVSLAFLMGVAIDVGNRRRRNFSGFHAFVACSTAVRLGNSLGSFEAVVVTLENEALQSAFFTVMVHIFTYTIRDLL